MIRFLLCSFALVLLYPTAIDLYLVGLPQIAQDLNATEAELHIAFSIYLAGMATTMLVAGRIADSSGRKPVAIIGATIFVAASILGATSTQSTEFLIARFAQGIGAGSCYVVAFAILRDVLDDQRRAKVLSMINGITCIVPVIAPVIGHLIMLQYPWPALFTTMSGMGVIVCLLSLFALKESRPKTAKQPLNEPANLESESFKDSYFLSRLMVTSFSVTMILTYVNVSPMLIMSDMGFDRGGYSTVMALTALISMLTSFSAPLLLARFEQRSLSLLSQTFFAASATTLIITNFIQLSHIGYFIGFGLLCAGFSLGFGVAMSQALSPFSKRAGVASSLLGISQVCSSAFYIWLAGILGISALYMLIIILAAGSLISFALILWIPKPTPLHRYEEISGTA